MNYRILTLYIHSCYTGTEVRWSETKNEKLRYERGASFVDLLGAPVIGAKDHPRKVHQRLIYVEFREYVWVIPIVCRPDEVFLKTAFPSRAHTKLWKGGWPL